ncbi:MAG: Gfo/Idh/MocA family oxidoreductase [Verrucomicrobiales bacterium]|nr:Gfo/Idh/MocA family oxidoreductase [Verrucomicrobiales bacterium]
MNQDHRDPKAHGETRRSFIQKAAATAATMAVSGIIKTPVYGQSQAPSTGHVLGANDRIVVAYVGTGGQGKAHVKSQKEHASENNIVQAAVCDVYQKRLDEAKTLAGLTDADAYRDHRKLLERKDIDAIVVATVDQWHCDVACDALEAGKHVFGEKPLARYLDEGFRIYDAVRRTGKVFVIGSQFCGDQKYHKAAEWIRAGKLGPLVWAQGSYCRNNPKNTEWTYPIDPDANESNLDWNRWLGRTLKIPFTPERYFSWHKFYDYNSGILGNLLSHTFLPLLLATGNSEFPRRVTCTGTRKVSKDREITDTTHVLAEMPSGLTFCIAGSTVNEVGLPEMIRGRQGTLYFASGQDQVALKPERPFTEEIEAEDFRGPAGSGDLALLEKNFFDCIRSGATPVASVDLAIRAHTILCLAETSERLGLMLYFDEKTRKIATGDRKIIQPISYDSKTPMTT